MIYLLAGAALLVFVLRDVFQTVIVPRGQKTGFGIARPIVRFFLWPPARYAASKLTSPVWKAEVLGLFAPFTLIMLLTLWVCLLIVAFGLIAFSFASEYSPPLETIYSAFYVSGSSFLTLGNADFLAKSEKVRVLTLATAFTGMIVTASVVSLMFTLIGAIQRREVLVSVTTNITDAPPSGVAILETYAKMNGRLALGDFYRDWHRWCADVYDSHKAYPMLPYFRSNDPSTSWLTALGAILDSISLLRSVDCQNEYFPATLTYHFGCRLVDELAQHWKLELKPLSEPSVEEFHSVYLRLREAGYCSIDESTARSNFARFRQKYAQAHSAVCKYLSVPETPISTFCDLQVPVAMTS